MCLRSVVTLKSVLESRGGGAVRLHSDTLDNTRDPPPERVSVDGPPKASTSVPLREWLPLNLLLLSEDTRSVRDLRGDAGDLRNTSDLCE